MSVRRAPRPAGMADLVMPFQVDWDSDRYPRSEILAGVPESDVQRDLIAFARSSGLELVHLDAGSAGIRGRLLALLESLGIKGPRATQMVAQLLSGVATVPKDWADLSGTIAPSGRSVFIEVKAQGRICQRTGSVLTEPGLPTKEQVSWLYRRHRMGAVVGVAWSCTDLVRILGPALLEHGRLMQNGIIPSGGTRV